MKKELTSGKTVFLFVGIVCLIFMWCNLLPPVATMGGADYYQIASGGFLLNSSNGAQTYYSSIPAEHAYRGTMNWILRPLSAVLPGLDVRVLSCVYLIVTLVAAAFFLWKLKPEKEWYRLLIAGVCVVIFCDFAYLLHLNSLNVEGAFYCILLVMTVLLLLQIHHKTTIWKTVLILALSLIAAGLKTGYFWLGILLPCLLCSTFYLRKDSLYRIVTSVLIVVTVGSSLMLFGGGVHGQKEKINLFHSVYYGVLKDSATPNAVSRLGLPEEVAAYSGKTFYDVDTSVTDDGRIYPSYGKIFTYYLTNPGEFLAKMERSADNAYEIRQQYISNYPDVQKLKYGFNLYSAFKRRFIQPDFWFVLVFLAAVVIFSVLQMRKEQNLSKKAHYFLMILLCVITLFCFVAPVIISGEAALCAELFLYNLFFDIVLANVLIGGSIILVKRRESVQQKFGVQQ